MKLSLFIILLLLCPISITAQEVIGDYVFVERYDPITDFNTSYIYTEELEASPIRNGKLYWRYNGYRHDVILHADVFLDNQAVDVVWRFDKEPTTSCRWNPSTEGTGLILPLSEFVAFTENSIKGTQVAIRVSNYRGTQYTFLFSLSGVSRALTRLPDPRLIGAFDYAEIKAPDSYYMTKSIYTTASTASGNHQSRISWMRIDGRLAILFSVDEVQFGLDPFINIIVSFSDSPQADQTWQNEGRSGVQYLLDDEAAGFTIDALNSDSVIFGWRGGNADVVEFQLHGLREALQLLPPP